MLYSLICEKCQCQFYNFAANISCSLGRVLVRSQYKQSSPHTGTAAGQLIRKMSTQQQRNRTRLQARSFELGHIELRRITLS